MSFEDAGEQPGDSNIAVITGASTTYDAVIIEFDVIYFGESQLECQWQFGSEEYLEFVDDKNDMPLLSIEGVPISYTPSCDNLVSVNSIHPAGINKDKEPYGSINEHLYMAPEDLDVTNGYKKAEFDGISIQLSSSIITKIDGFHVRYSIADVDDDYWDSAFFIENNSVKSVDQQNE